MATTLESQLLAIKSFMQGEPEQTKKPFTRPSIIFDPKEAADIDLEAILSIALSGLEILIEKDRRFEKYKDTLFSYKSRELDREMMGIEENKKIDASISLYLRLLAGYLDLPPALKTLEYLIRRYKVHVHNIDELVLCALPYHDTHAFVCVVQIIDLGKKKWGFLEGVKASGAPPPRKVIVQQCIRDLGVLEALCNYAQPTKKFQHSRAVVCFCTAVVVEALGAIPTLDSDIVLRILPFVFAGFDPDLEAGPDYKAGAMMIVGVLATRATLASKLVQRLILLVAKLAQQDAKQSTDLPRLRLSLMAIISLVQSIQTFPKKVLDVLKEIRDLAGVLRGLSKEFNIEKFLSVYLGALADYSSSDDSCRLALITNIETVDMKDFVDTIVIKVLTTCVKLSQTTERSKLSDSGSWAKQILVAVDKCYPSELRGAVRKFLEDPKVHSKQDDPIFEVLCLMFDGRLDVPAEISHSKLWFSLEHPKAEVRLAALSGLSKSGVLKAKSTDKQLHLDQKLMSVQEAILRRLRDDDLSVIQAVLSLDGVSGITDPTCFLKTLQDVLLRCIDLLTKKGTSSTLSQACDVAVSCLQCSVNFLQHQHDYSKEVATMMFPFLLIFPKTWKLNVKALELLKEIQWPFYHSLWNGYDHISGTKIKKMKPSDATSYNMKTLGALAEIVIAQPQEFMPWLIECRNSSNLSKTLFFMIIFQSFMIPKEGVGNLSALWEGCFQVFKHEWRDMVSKGDDILSEEFSAEYLDKVCIQVMGKLFDTNLEALNSNILICIYWSLLKVCATMALEDMAGNGVWVCILEDLFVFSASSHLKDVFLEHLLQLVIRSDISPVQFLSKFFTEEGYSASVQVESLHSFATICSTLASSRTDGIKNCSHVQFLLAFPSLLVPISSDNQDIRMAALNSMEGLYDLLHHFDVSSVKKGNDSVSAQSIFSPAFNELLGLMLREKSLISSDVNFLSSLLTSVLASTASNLLVPQNIHQRFNQHTKEAILRFIFISALKFSAYGKFKVLSLFRGIGNGIMNLEEVKLLVLELLNRRSQYHFGLDKSCKELSRIEIETLCLLLECCASVMSSLLVGDIIEDCLFQALNVEGASLTDPAIIQPCIAVLQKLARPLYESLKTELQDKLFQDILILSRKDSGDIQNAARDALLRINVTYVTVSRLLNMILALEGPQNGSLNKPKRKKTKKNQHFDLLQSVHSKGENIHSFLSALLDFLLLKKDKVSRASLIGPLFELLDKLFKNDWLLAFIDEDEKEDEDSSDISHNITQSVDFLQQTTLLILEEICVSLSSGAHVEDDICNKFDVTLLVECARTAKDVTTRNHVFLLLTSIAKLVPDRILDHIIDIFTVIGESAIMQSDNHSQSVSEGLISAVVPFWLSKTDNVQELLQIFITVLPEVAEHRRLTLMVCLLRILGESSSLGPLLFLLFRSLVLRASRLRSDGNVYAFISSPSMIHTEWEYHFALQVCDQYSCTIWLPSLVSLLQEIGIDNQHQQQTAELVVAMHFILQKLQDTELVFKLDSVQDPVDLQGTLGALLEQVVSHLQLGYLLSKQINIPTTIRKELKECTQIVLKTITSVMVPAAYFKAITQLLVHADDNVRKKALGLLCETLKDSDKVQKRKERKKLHWNSTNSGFHMDESAWDSFNEMCQKIVQLVDSSVDDSDIAVKLAAVSALEVLANKFSHDNSNFTRCLTSVVMRICSDKLDLSSSCLRCTAALVNVLGPRALFELPCLMEHLLRRAREVSSHPASFREPLLYSVLATLEAVLDKLGSFLNPYLGDIMELMVLHPEFASESDPKMKLKADAVRRSIPEKIPVRLVLAPLLNIYPKAIQYGQSSLSVAFEILASTIALMDRSSIGSYRAKIFEQCLLALDLRRQHPVSIQNIDAVEHTVIHAIIVLTMKLTETMFRPLFVRSLEWAESELEDVPNEGKSLDRMISFYNLINKLTEQHRSLFVPYFKYLLDGCARYLTDDQSRPMGSTQKRKKARVLGINSATEAKGLASPSLWHLRALVLSSLYKCFLYDTGSLKFLDSSNFQVLLKPIVSQIGVEPPASLDQLPNLPGVEEVNDTLVSCIGQMAVAAGSDLLWKPLNHEVLMQTRSENVRSRILGLRVVKYLVKHLKEEYLVFLPETIPFLGELLEDVELPVKSLAQEILKEMETLSGESLRQYL